MVSGGWFFRAEGVLQSALETCLITSLGGRQCLPASSSSEPVLLSKEEDEDKTNICQLSLSLPLMPMTVELPASHPTNLNGHKPWKCPTNTNIPAMRQQGSGGTICHTDTQ